MGLILRARCGECSYEEGALRLGGTHEQIAQHDVSAFELFRAPCCRTVQSIEVLLGFAYPRVACAGCGASAAPTAEARYRVATMRGEVLDGHACPRCERAALSFEPTGKFI